MRSSGLLKEPGTPERLRHALTVGDIPEDVASPDTPGVKNRIFRIIDMLSVLWRSRHITDRQYAAGIEWRELWYNSGSTQRVVSKMEPPVSGGRQELIGRTLDARRAYERASIKLGPGLFSLAFGVCLEDEAPKDRMAGLRDALDILARHFGI